MKLLLITILSILFLGSFDSKVQLEDFIITEEELPNGYQLRQILSDDNVPCDFQANPFIFSNRNYVDCFIRNFYRDSTLTKNVKKGLFSVYEGQSEVGIFGLETDSEKIADLLINDLSTTISDDPNSEIIQSGNIIIWLWQDREKTNSFDEFIKLINARIKQ